MTKVVNLTGAPLSIVARDGEGLEQVVATFEPAGHAMCRQYEVAEMLPGTQIPLVRQVYERISGLPAPEEGTIYIVDPYLATAAKAVGRTDVVYPHEPWYRGENDYASGWFGLARPE